MKKFSLYDYILNETHNLRNGELQRIAAELIFAMHNDSTETAYLRMINLAIENINEYLDLELPKEK